MMSWEDDRREMFFFSFLNTLSKNMPGMIDENRENTNQPDSGSNRGPQKYKQ
jgi:hypothetical protein